MLHSAQLWQGDWYLLAERAAWYAPTRTLVIADLHMGYAASRRAAGWAIPDIGWHPVQQRLSTCLRRLVVREVIIAGDLVEDVHGAGPARELVRWLQSEQVRVRLVPGNHDRELGFLEGLDITSELELGGWKIQHEPHWTPGVPTVSGHVHPVLRLPGWAGWVPCFGTLGRSLILPAFSDDAAGVNVAAYHNLGQLSIWPIAGDKVLPPESVAALVQTRSRSKPVRDKLSGRRCDTRADLQKAVRPAPPGRGNERDPGGRK